MKARFNFVAISNYWIGENIGRLRPRFHGDFVLNMQITSIQVESFVLDLNFNSSTERHLERRARNFPFLFVYFSSSCGSRSFSRQSGASDSEAERKRKLAMTSRAEICK